jgi:hypothetical protein
MLYVYKWQYPYIVEEWDHNWIAFREHGLGNVEVVSELTPLSRECIPPHDVLPLLENLHRVEFLVEGEVSQDVLAHTILYVVFVADKV